MQTEASILERVTQAYMARRGLRLLCMLVVFSSALLLCLLDGGLPPWSWRLLVQALQQTPALLAVHGKIVFVALAGLVLLSVTVLLAWWGLLWLAWRMLAYWWYERQELRQFAMDIDEAHYLVTDNEEPEDNPALSSQRFTQFAEEEEEEAEELPYQDARMMRRRIVYPRAPMDQAPDDLFEETEEEEEQPRVYQDQEIDEADAAAWQPASQNLVLAQTQSRSYAPPLRPMRLVGGKAYESTISEQSVGSARTEDLQHNAYEPKISERLVGSARTEDLQRNAYEPKISEQLVGSARTQDLQHSSYGHILPSTGTAALAPISRLSPMPYDCALAPTAPMPYNYELAPTMPYDSELAPTVPRSELNLLGSQAGMQLVVGTGLDAGVKRRGKPNEDSLLALQNTRVLQGSPAPVGLFVVADGMGGHENGQEASRTVIQSLSKTLVPSIIFGPTDDNYAELLAEGIHHANLAVYQRNRQSNADMGTTIAAALIVDNTAYIANVGDSRVYLYRETSGLSQITRDHSTVARLVENGLIKPDDIYTHPRRNEIYRSLGRHPSEDIDHFTLALQPGDLLLLCSDGLWEMVRDPQITHIIRTTLPQATQTSASLVQAALEGGGKDNIGLIVVYIKPAR